MNRKDDHIKYALSQQIKTNDFDRIRLVHESIPEIGIDDVNYSTYIGQFKSPVPIYINAMTGGSEDAREINRKLAQVASKLDIPFALGSFSSGLKEAAMIDTYDVFGELKKRPIVLANIGADKTLEDAKRTVELLRPDLLQIHINAPQEMVMPEGDRDFSSWKKNIKDIVQNIDCDVIVKEVGFGMSKKTVIKLKKLGVKLIDVGGKGGTDFVAIENNRRRYKMHYLENYGLSTVESLLEIKHVSNMRVYASGGVRHALDVVKALALGAEAVGLSRYFLELVTNNTVEDVVKEIQSMLYEIKEIMVLLNAKNIHDLRHAELIYDLELTNVIAQRT